MAACGVGWQAANDNDNVFDAPKKGLRIVAHCFPEEMRWWCEYETREPKGGGGGEG